MALITLRKASMLLGRTVLNSLGEWRFDGFKVLDELAMKWLL